jgi:hypothetical protein
VSSEGQPPRLEDEKLTHISITQLIEVEYLECLLIALAPFLLTHISRTPPHHRDNALFTSISVV